MHRRYPHPFTTQKDWEWPHAYAQAKDTPRTLIELRMCELSAAIREKLDWHVKFRDDTIRAKWKQEIEEQQAYLHPGLKLTENMVRNLPL